MIKKTEFCNYEAIKVALARAKAALYIFLHKQYNKLKYNLKWKILS